MKKLAMKTHLDVQQREDIRRDRAERVKFVPPDLRVRESVLYWQEDPNEIHQRRKSGTWLKVATIAVKGQHWCLPFFHENASKLRRHLDTVDLEELPDSRMRTRAPVLWLSCEGQIDVWVLFSHNSYLSAILDRQGLSVAVPVDLRTQNSESFSPQLLQGFYEMR